MVCQKVPKLRMLQSFKLTNEVNGIKITARPSQHLWNTVVSVLRRKMKRSVSVGIMPVHIGAGLDERLQDLKNKSKSF